MSGGPVNVNFTLYETDNVESNRLQLRWGCMQGRCNVHYAASHDATPSKNKHLLATQIISCSEYMIANCQKSSGVYIACLTLPSSTRLLLAAQSAAITSTVTPWAADESRRRVHRRELSQPLWTVGCWLLNWKSLFSTNCRENKTRIIITTHMKSTSLNSKSAIT